MAGGYNGQLVALDVNTPSEDELTQGQADYAQAQGQVARQTVGADVAMKNAQATSAQQTNAINGLNLQQQIQYNTYRQHLLQKQQEQASLASSQSQLSGTGGSAASPAPQPSPAAQPATPLFDPRIQQVMQSADASDPNAAANWDQQMGQLADEGVPQARQFIGQFSKSNLNGWRGQIGAHQVNSQLGSMQGGASPLAGATGGAAPAQGSPLAAQAPAGSQLAPAPAAPAVSPLTGQVDPDLAAMAIIDPKGTGEFMKMQGMMKYQQTGDINVLARYAPDLYKDLTEAQKNLTGAQKEALATKTSNMGQAANAVLALAHQLGSNAPEVRAAYNDTVVTAAQQGWITPQAAKQELAAKDIDFGHLSFLATYSQTVSEAMTSSGQTAANEAAARAAHPEANWQYIGVDANGKPIYHNTHGAPGAADQIGNTVVSGKPGAGVATAQFKHDMMVKAGYSEADAAAVAGGSKVMTQAQIMAAAQRAASADAMAAAMSNPGAPPINIEDRANELASQWQAAATPGAGGEPAAAATSTAAPNVHTPAQIKAAQSYKGASAPLGSNAHPSMPTPAQVARIPADTPHSFYIHPDGQLRYKGSIANMTKYMGS